MQEELATSKLPLLAVKEVHVKKPESTGTKANVMEIFRCRISKHFSGENSHEPNWDRRSF